MTSPAYIEGKRLGQAVVRMARSGESWNAVSQFLAANGAKELIPHAEGMYRRNGGVDKPPTFDELRKAENAEIQSKETA